MRSPLILQPTQADTRAPCRCIDQAFLILHLVAAEDAGRRDVERACGIEGFSVRDGINTGLVIVGVVGAGGRAKYAELGDANNTGPAPAGGDPARLGPGARRHSAARRVAFRWAGEGQLELKAKTALFAAVEVLGVSGTPSRLRGFDEPRRRWSGESVRWPPGALAVEAALAGSAGVVFLTGEPGISKTRLLAELRVAFEDGSPARGRPGGSRAGASRTASRRRHCRTAPSMSRAPACVRTQHCRCEAAVHDGREFGKTSASYPHVEVGPRA